MPRVGGVYSLPSGNPISNGSVASSSTMNTTLDDLGDEITNSIPRDGSAAATADLPMGTRKHTGVGNATARTHYAAAGQIQDGGLVTLGSVAGTNTITGALTPAITGYVAGMRVSFEPANTNTGAATIAINGLSAVDIKKGNGVALRAGDLPAGIPAYLIYDGTQFILINQVEESGSFTATLSGMADTTQGTIQYRRTGTAVMLNVPSSFFGTSNTTAMVISGVPAGIQPQLEQHVICPHIMDAGTLYWGIAHVKTGGTIELFRMINSGGFAPSSGGTFTASGLKGLGNFWTLTYSLG
jgi:hypothetical protein